MKPKNRYRYEGSVIESYSKKLVKEKWIAETSAPSISRARANFVYQFKQESGWFYIKALTLPGQIKEIA